MQQLTGLDQMFLSLDSPTTNAVLGGLVLFDTPEPGQPLPDEAFMRARLTERLPLIPPMSKRIVPVPLGLDHSYLAECDRIDVGAHLHTIQLPGAGGDEELAAEVARIMGTPLVTDGPLWDYTIIEGLAGGGIAHLLRIHHGMVDGTTMPTVWDLFADEPVAPLPEAAPLHTLPEPMFGGPEMAARAVTGTLARPVRQVGLAFNVAKWLVRQYPVDGLMAAPALVARMVPGMPGRALVGAVNFQQRRKGRAEIVPYLPTWIPPATSFNGRASSHRQFAFHDMDLGEVKAVSRAAGTTLNNVVVAICAGAVRRYMQDHGGVPDRPIIVCVPVSLRHPDIKEPWSNHVHMMFAPLPTHIADPLERLRLVTRDLVAAKKSYDAMPIHLLRDASRFVPRDLFGWLTQLWIRLPDNWSRGPWNVVVSNVKGLSTPATMNGLRVAGYWPASFVSIGGGINITLQSYVDRICFGFIGPLDKTGDLWPLVGYMQESLDELKEAVAAASARTGPPAHRLATSRATARSAAAAGGTARTARPRRASTKGKSRSRTVTAVPPLDPTAT